MIYRFKNFLINFFIKYFKLFSKDNQLWLKMRNPIEFVMDLYDHEFQYYRWFIHRRLLFSEIKFSDLKQYISYNIFAHNDYENVGNLLTQTTLTGLSAGKNTWLNFKYLKPIFIKLF